MQDQSYQLATSIVHSRFFRSQTPPHVLPPAHDAPAACTRDGGFFGLTVALTQARSFFFL